MAYSGQLEWNETSYRTLYKVKTSQQESKEGSSSSCQFLILIISPSSRSIHLYTTETDCTS